MADRGRYLTQTTAPVNEVTPDAFDFCSELQNLERLGIFSCDPCDCTGVKLTFLAEESPNHKKRLKHIVSPNQVKLCGLIRFSDSRMPSRRSSMYQASKRKIERENFLRKI
jgi:hypothetical protein